MKWYDFTRGLLERIDSFPNNQRFVSDVNGKEVPAAAPPDEMGNPNYIGGRLS